MAKKADEKTATPAEPQKHPGGRPTDYRPEYCEQAEKLCRLGATDIEIADFFGVNESTILRWKAKYEEFCRSIKTGKELSDERVERALFTKATGFEHDEIDIRTCDGVVVQTPIRKYYPPDSTAAIFWLKNRRGWKDKVELGGPDGGPIQVQVIDYSHANANPDSP
jgi:hypothetical protein